MVHHALFAPLPSPALAPSGDISEQAPPPAPNKEDYSLKFSRLRPVIEREAAKLSVVSAVHPLDHIFRFLLEHPEFYSKEEEAVRRYFEDGALSARKFAELLDQYCGETASQAQVLEFASGYGCVTRHLIRQGIDLESCDIHPAAIDFLQTKLGVRTIQSSPVPEMAVFPHQYDFVFVLSFFSHMPITTWTRWLTRLTQCLRPGGVIAFTTHGIACLTLLSNPQIPANGFWFAPTSEQLDLPTEDYGATLVTEEFVRNAVSSIPSVELAEVRLAYWWGHQDLYVVRKTG
jgi:2-polyprenyl-3-methyl-5-hydroxy-6-metoxy-1,4-benzoquinol methylase